ncbi:hypothetical protein B8W97_02675 [Staphylococcus haemolyticus]|nr:hypothetical protein B8W97_02675 [Staphylococcus haemolyticus]
MQIKTQPQLQSLKPQQLSIFQVKQVPPKMLHLVQIQQKKVLHHLQQIVKQVQIQRQINLHQILKSKIARCQILILKLQVHQLLIIQQVIIAPLQRKILIVKPTRHLLIVKKVVLQPMIIVLRQQVQKIIK